MNADLPAKLTNLNIASLPGIDAHRRMAPLPDRLSEKYSSDVRKAGVMILLYEMDGSWFFPLIQRSSHNSNDPHSGQISFPGGRFDEEDENIRQTSLRETEEEIGVPSSEIKILTPLSKLYIPVSKNLVFPFIGFYSSIPEFRKMDSEVEMIWPCNLDVLINENNRIRKVLKTSYSDSIEVPGFQFEDFFIWGATAMILEEFIHVVEQLS
ncbi:MAG: CoA pyrophosphatase [Bacteroidota bacterium]|nr:CoA pyrophosphatase [Bacteroidota bacterium]